MNIIGKSSLNEYFPKGPLLMGNISFIPLKSRFENVEKAWHELYTLDVHTWPRRLIWTMQIPEG